MHSKTIEKIMQRKDVKIEINTSAYQFATMMTLWIDEINTQSMHLLGNTCWYFRLSQDDQKNISKYILVLSCTTIKWKKNYRIGEPNPFII